MMAVVAGAGLVGESDGWEETGLEEGAEGVEDLESEVVGWPQEEGGGEANFGEVMSSCKSMACC